MKAKMKRGESATNFAEKFDSEEPVIHLNCGPLPYIWVGGKNGPCYATLSGKATLRKLANGILTQIDGVKRNKKS